VGNGWHGLVDVEASFELGHPLPLLASVDQHLPCVQRPRDYDPDRPLKIKKQAAKACRKECPALASCTQLLTQVGDDTTGVLAGVILKRRWPEHTE
jgi:hypothetical protein